MFARTIWNSSTYREITALIREHHPDVVHCHNTFPLISPSVYYAAAKQGVPVVQTLHNYRLVCINPYLYRNGRICEDCLGRSPLRGVMHRCYRGSIAASFTVAAMLMVHRLLGTYRNKITTYIALTEFGRRKFLEARLCDPSRVVVKPNAVAAEAAPAEVLGTRYQVLANSQSTSKDTPEALAASASAEAAPAEVLGTRYQVLANSQSTSKDTPEALAASASAEAVPQVLGTRYQVLANTRSTPKDNPEALAAGATAEAVPEVLGTRYKVLANTEFDPKDNPEALAPSTYPLIPEHCCGRPATVLYVGRLSPEKGVDILINAWLLCHDKLPPGSRLHIIGDGPERAKLQCMAEGHSEIIFLGSIPHEQISSHMRSATALVLPTRCYEMFAITPLEAMQIGLPIILSSAAATGSIVKGHETGLVFENGIEKSLADLLESYLLERPDRLHQIGIEGQLSFENSPCRPEGNLKLLLKIYRQAIAQTTSLKSQPMSRTIRKVIVLKNSTYCLPENRMAEYHGAIFVEEFRRRGVDAIKMVLGDPAKDEPISEFLCVSSKEQRLSPDWWREQKCDLVIYYNGQNIRNTPVLHALKEGLPNCTRLLKMDTPLGPPIFTFREAGRIFGRAYIKDRHGHAKKGGDHEGNNPFSASIVAAVRTIRAAQPSYQAKVRNLFAAADYVSYELDRAVQGADQWAAHHGFTDLRGKFIWLGYPVRPEFASPLGVSRKPGSIISVAHWRHPKDLNLHSRALVDVFKNNNEATATIIGANSNVLKEMVLKLMPSAEKRVTQIAEISNKDLPTHLHSAQVFMLCSFTEGLCCSVVEALCAGCSAALSTGLGVPSFPRLVENDCGTQARSRSVVDMAAAVLTELDLWKSKKRDADHIRQTWSHTLVPNLCTNICDLCGFDLPS